MTVAHLITRTVYHGSEWKSYRIMQENSAVCELVGLSPDTLKKTQSLRCSAQVVRDQGRIRGAFELYDDPFV